MESLNVTLFDGKLITGIELFPEDDLDAALARAAEHDRAMVARSATTRSDPAG